jgi:cell shape-determining protein MreD
VNIGLSHLVVLLTCMIVAKIISMIIKRPVNGAFAYLIVGGVLASISILKVFNTGIVSVNDRWYVLGQIIGSLFLPFILALFFSYRFAKKYPKQKESNELEESPNK